MNRNLSMALIVVAILMGGQYLVHAADQSTTKGGALTVTSSPATTNVTDLWIVDQSTRTVYLCRASGGASAPPDCTKGTRLP